MTACMQVLLAMGGPRITLSNQSPSSFVITPATANCSYGLTTAGDVTVNGGDVGDWIAPKAAAPGAYECRLTVNSGATPTGSATATWIAMTFGASWNVTRSTVGTTTSNCTIEIRDGSGVVKASASISFQAQVDL